MTNHLKLADSYLRLSDEEKKYGNESEHRCWSPRATRYTPAIRCW